MPKYLCLQRGLPRDPDAAPPGPAQMQAMYARFAEWQATFADHLVDLGGRLGEGTLVTDEHQRTDGPLVEIKELVGGYMIVQADDLAKAIEVARACPGVVRPGSGIEVIEIQTP